MRRYLLDTHTFLWWVEDSPQLSERVRRIIADKESEILLSSVVGWEVSIKAAQGKLELREHPAKFLSAMIERNKFTPLPIGFSHVTAIYDLPTIHRDPFDRLLIAQSQRENAPLMSNDPIFREYRVKVVW